MCVQVAQERRTGPEESGSERRALGVVVMQKGDPQVARKEERFTDQRHEWSESVSVCLYVHVAVPAQTPFVCQRASWSSLIRRKYDDHDDDSDDAAVPAVEHQTNQINNEHGRRSAPLAQVLPIPPARQSRSPQRILLSEFSIQAASTGAASQEAQQAQQLELLESRRNVFQIPA